MCCVCVHDLIYDICIYSNSKCFTDKPKPALESNTAAYRHQNPHNFKEGSMVRYGEPASFGTIKWIGMLPSDQKMVYAGLEMVGICII